MSVLDEPRIWVPTDPHIGPDSDDLTLLAPTGDSAVDLGGAALAVHRVGAAACEVVAREPLCDEFQLVEALAAARAAFADPLIDSISKSLGNERYAGLLARDLFDDAEQTALGVYGACVSKGVAPPLAIQRAGLVYGVPAHDLGNYMSIAAEPKAHPIAIADAADRAVVRWASSVAREETAATKINKAMDSDDFEQAVAEGHIQRGRRGRFVRTTDPEMPRAVAEALSRMPETQAEPQTQPGTLAWLREQLGGGGQSAPTVEGAPAPPKPAVRKRPKRPKRPKRLEPIAEQRISAPLISRIGQALSSTLNPVLGSKLRAAMEAKHKAEQHPYPDPVDSLRRYEDYETYGRLDTTLSWAIDAPTGRSLVDSFTKSNAGNNERVVRAGLLEEILGQAEQWNTTEHYDVLASYVNPQLREDIVIRTHRIRAAELEQASSVIPDDSKSVAAYAEAEGYLDGLAVDGDGRFNPLLKMWMAVAKDANPNTGDWYVIALPEPKSTGSDSGVIYDPVPEVVEFVVYDEHGEVRGNIHPGAGSKHAEYQLDKNQVYVVEEPTERWDDTRGSWIVRYHLRPARPDEFEKALTPQQRRRLVMIEPRDQSGRWVETPTEEMRRKLAQMPTPTAESALAPPRRQLRKRPKRVLRPTRTQQQPLVQSRLGTRLQSNVRSPLSPADLQSILQRLPDRSEPKAPALLDQGIYKVFDPDIWNTMRYLATKGLDEFPDEVVLRGRSLSLYRSHKHLNDARYLNGEQADAELRALIMNEGLSQPQDRLLFQDKAGEGDYTAWEQMLNKADDILADPTNSTVFVNLENQKGSDDVWLARGNAMPMKPRVLIIDDVEDLDMDKPVVLRRVRDYRQSQLRRAHHPSWDPTRRVDSHLKIYRLVQGDAVAYRAENE